MAPTPQIPETMANDPHLRKFWEKRHQLFSKIDEGVEMPDTCMWHMVTPEPNAIEHAKRFKGKKTVVDAFGGCGGNSIQLAKVVDKVHYVELNPNRLEAAKKNAKIYGVEDKIEFHLGDFMEVSKTLKADGVFLAPLWTTKINNSYNDYVNFDIQNMEPIPGDKIFAAGRSISKNVALFMPVTTPFHQLSQLADAGEHVEFYNEPNPFEVGTAMGLTAYYGDLAKKY